MDIDRLVDELQNIAERVNRSWFIEWRDYSVQQPTREGEYLVAYRDHRVTGIEIDVIRSGFPIPLKYLIKCKKCGMTKETANPIAMKLAKEK